MQLLENKSKAHLRIHRRRDTSQAVLDHKSPSKLVKTAALPRIRTRHTPEVGRVSKPRGHCCEGLWEDGGPVRKNPAGEALAP